MIDLPLWGLDGLVRGEPTILYHGTTRLFRSFDLGKSRTKLVNKFYGKGIFLVPSKEVAEKYALANRNIGFEPSIVDDLKRRNPEAGHFLAFIVKKGRVAWNDYPLFRGVPEGEQAATLERALGGLDSNTIADVAEYVIGSKEKPRREDGPTLFDFFSGTTGLPEYVYKMLDDIGLDSRAYRPKVYKVRVHVNNVLVTASRARARAARQRGHDAVIFHGADLVDGVPEVAVFDPKNVQILGYEIV